MILNVLEEAPEGLLHGIIQGGTAAICLALVLFWIVKPMLGAMIAQQSTALHLLQQCVDAFTSAVNTFNKFQDQEEQAHQEINRLQNRSIEILKVLMKHYKLNSGDQDSDNV